MIKESKAPAAMPTHVGIVGGGLLGAGIAIQMLRRGLRTTIVDADPQAPARIARQVRVVFDELRDWGQVPPDRARPGQAEPIQAEQALQALVVTADLAPLADADWVIEAIPEVLEAKLALYRQLAPVLAPGCVLSSNTSGLVPALLEPALADPTRFLITHYWNAPHAVPLVEIVPGSHTKAAVLAQVQHWVRATGNEPVLLNKAIPGFVGNRIQFAVLREALSIVAQGAASPEAVDQVVQATLGKRYPYAGPFKIADMGGLQTFLQIARHLFPDLADGSDGLPVLDERVQAGKLGAASGEGFYTWDAALRAQFAAGRKRAQS